MGGGCVDLIKLILHVQQGYVQSGVVLQRLHLLLVRGKKQEVRQGPGVPDGMTHTATSVAQYPLFYSHISVYIEGHSLIDTFQFL